MAKILVTITERIVSAPADFRRVRAGHCGVIAPDGAAAQQAEPLEHIFIATRTRRIPAVEVDPGLPENAPLN